MKTEPTNTSQPLKQLCGGAVLIIVWAGVGIATQSVWLGFFAGITLAILTYHKVGNPPQV